MPPRYSSVRPRVAVSIALAVTVAALTGCAGSDSSDFTSKGVKKQAAAREKTRVVAPAQREPAPGVEGTTLEGKSLSLSSYEGEVVLLNFWASWCPPCRDEVSVLQKIQQKTSDQGVAIVGVDMMDSKANAKAFARTHDIDYPSIYDQPGAVALQFRGTMPPQAVPTTIIIDRQGRIAGRILGEAHYDQLMPMVRRVASGGP